MYCTQPRPYLGHTFPQIPGIHIKDNGSHDFDINPSAPSLSV